MDIAAIVDEHVTKTDLENFRKAYDEQAKRGAPSAITVFNYAHSLIKSTRDDVNTGIFLLEGLLRRDSEDIPKRDYVYYLAIAHTRLKEYDRALEYINVLLSAEGDNRQALDLKELIEKRMKKEGFLGLLLLAFGGGAAIAAGVVAAAVLAKRH